MVLITIVTGANLNQLITGGGHIVDVEKPMVFRLDNDPPKKRWESWWETQCYDGRSGNLHVFSSCQKQRYVRMEETPPGARVFCRVHRWICGQTTHFCDFLSTERDFCALYDPDIWWSQRWCIAVVGSGLQEQKRLLHRRRTSKSQLRLVVKRRWRQSGAL